jgi:hypothetical protein
MGSNSEKRDKTRFEHFSKIILENSEIGVHRDARIVNFSDNGIYIQADLRLEPEAEIRIGIQDSPFASEPNQFESYRGVVKWRKELKNSHYYYGYGVELIKESVQSDGQNRYQWSRDNPRKACNIPVNYEVENRIFEGIAENIGSDGVRVKSKDRVQIGKQITIDIPMKKKGKIARLKGHVSWSNPRGFGVQFLRSDRD